ncbi:uncharacterized protein FPRO_10328 [Fusarium proliferatum ET1]|uniref:Uncharacterized protein n=1 Tax=Fusarium proliferatum (strain ET1) TaxID=1227346 RepID=A0A1L7VM20_FUSPR|nr:uncharacterized protein FPRO_10328 [Fusarium proliferatum ET1]CZR40740.1 uncharacterized protein FPRO_10328 [Fusarium proliferatum ET1]
MSGERQLFRDLGDQTGIVSVTSGGEIDAYRNIQETGAYAGQVHDVSLYHVAQALLFLFIITATMSVQCLPTRTTTPSLPTAGGGYVGITREGAELDQLARSMIEASPRFAHIMLSLHD